MIFREGCLNLLVGPQNTGKTALIVRGLKAGGWQHGVIYSGTEHAHVRCSRAFPMIRTSEDDTLDGLGASDISDGGVVVFNYCMTYDVAQWQRIATLFRPLSS